MAEQPGFACLDYEDISQAVKRTWTICTKRLIGAIFGDAAMRRAVFKARHRRFARSLPRLILAYRTGAMRYGIFTLVARRDDRYRGVHEGG